MPYFATKPTDEIASELEKRKSRYYEHLKRSGRLQVYRRMFDNYFKAIRHKGRIYYSGEQGEYINLDIADLRNIILHLKVLTTSQKPAFEPKAINTDVTSQAQTILASGLLDYYLRKQKIARFMDDATEKALLYGEGYVSLDWNATGGEPVAVDQTQAENPVVMNEGELEAGSFGPADVIIDWTNRTPRAHSWRMTRSFVSKWLVASKYGRGDPKTYSAIEEVTYDDKLRDTVYYDENLHETELIPVYTWYHRKDDSMPNGRMVKWITPKIVLSDGPLPFDEIPLYRIAAADLDGTPFGYTIAYDLLPIQEAIDKLSGIITTNQGTFGVSNVLIPDGSNLTFQMLADGLNGLTYNPAAGKPEVLNLTATPAEVFQWITTLRGIMETISGVNSVARGQIDAKLSGAAMALIQSMAIQFNSGLQQSYAELAEDVGTGIIQILKRNAKSKRVALIAGKSNRSYMKEWTAADLSNITHVLVDLGNPLMRTTAGRVNMADQLLANGHIKKPDQYIQVITTGKLEPMYEGEQAELMEIRSENEKFGEGNATPVIMTDNHALHISEHKCVLSSPEAREDSRIVQVVLEHIQEHINQLRTADPALLGLLGQPQIPPAPPPPGAQAPGMPGPGAAPPVPGGPPPIEGQMPTDQAIEASGANLPNMPAMPKNPMSGQPFNPATGGM